MAISVEHWIYGLNRGGTETLLYRLLQQTSQDRFLEQTVVSLTDEGCFGEAIRGLGVRVVCFHLHRRKLRGLCELWRWSRRERPQVIQTWLYHADLFGVLGKWLSGAKLVWNIRCSDADHRCEARRWNWLIRGLAWFSWVPEAVVVNSRAGQRYHQRRGYRPKRWVYLPNGFLLNERSGEARSSFRKELGTSDSSFVVGIVARYDPLKDHALFLRAARLLLEKRPDCHFVLVGDGVDERNSNLMPLVPKDKTARFHFLGERSDVAAILGGLDVFTLCSKSEGFPNTVGEAMASGLPCVVTDVGACRELVGETGRVVRHGDPSALCSAWESLFELGVEGRHALGTAARARIEAEFKMSEIARKYSILYSGLQNVTEPYEDSRDFSLLPR